MAAVDITLARRRYSRLLRKMNCKKYIRLISFFSSHKLDTLLSELITRQTKSERDGGSLTLFCPEIELLQQIFTHLVNLAVMGSGAKIDLEKYAG